METNNSVINSPAAENLEEFFETHDSKYIAEDAIFKNMTTGEETKGRQAISGNASTLYIM